MGVEHKDNDYDYKDSYIFRDWFHLLNTSEDHFEDYTETQCDDLLFYCVLEKQGTIFRDYFYFIITVQLKIKKLIN